MQNMEEGENYKKITTPKKITGKQAGIPNESFFDNSEYLLSSFSNKTIKKH